MVRLHGAPAAVEDTQRIQPSLRSVMYGFAALNLVLAISAITFILVRYRHAEIQALQPFFLVLVALGVVISSFTTLFLSADDVHLTALTGVACNAALWTYCMGFVVSYAPLFLKLWRVTRAFRFMTPAKIEKAAPERFAPIPKGVIAPTMHLVAWLVVAAAVEALLLGAWNAINPLKYKRITEPYAGPRPLRSYGVCRPTHPNGTPQAVFIALLVTYHVLILLAGIYLAHRARNVDTRFSEARWVLYCMVSTVQIVVIGVPLLALVSKVRSTLTRCAAHVPHFKAPAPLVRSKAHSYHSIVAHVHAHGRAVPSFANSWLLLLLLPEPTYLLRRLQRICHH